MKKFEILGTIKLIKTTKKEMFPKRMKKKR